MPLVYRQSDEQIMCESYRSKKANGDDLISSSGGRSKQKAERVFLLTAFLLLLGSPFRPPLHGLFYFGG
jgi:hypothetical protein